MMEPCHRLEHLAYCDVLPGIIDRFITMLPDADPAAPVPTCPDWTVADLAEHIGGVHRWAANHIAVLSPERIPGKDMDFEVPSEHAQFPAWMDAGAERLVSLLRAGDPTAPMWGWGADKHLRFWSRRMVYETLIHACDLARAIGLEAAEAAELGVDGVDEFLENLPHAAYFAPKVTELLGEGERLTWRATDAQVVWTITLRPDAFTWSHDDDDATVILEGPAGALLELAWGRRRPDEPAFRVAGDEKLLTFWIERSSL